MVSWLTSKEMDMVTLVQILDDTANTLGKSMNPTILPQGMGK